MKLSELLAELRNSSNSRWRAPRHPFFRVLAWFWAGSTVLTLLGAIVVTILLHNARFHDYLRRTVEQKATEDLGVRVQLQNFALNFSDLSLDLYGVTIDGASPYANPPLLQVDHVETGVRIVSILKRSWYLDSFRIDHPVIHVFMDAHGGSNIPTIKSSGQGSNTSVFDLGIRHAVIDHGEFYFNDRPSDIAADLHDLEFSSSFNSLLKKYSGTVAYSDGHVTYGTFQPFAHSLNAQFDATPTTFNLSRAKLSLGKSNVILSAVMQNYSDPQVNGRYEVTADCKDLGAILHQPSVPVGIVRANGNLQFHQAANQPVLNALIVDGDLASASLSIHTPSARAQIERIAAHYQLANGNTVLRDFHAAALGGDINAAGSMKNLGGDSHSDFTAAVRGVSLASLTAALGPAAKARAVSVAGKLNADAKASWGKSFNDLVAHADSTIQGRVQPSRAAVPQAVSLSGGGANAAPSASSFPIESAIHATYSASNGQLALDNSYARTPQTNLTMNGVVGSHSSVKLDLKANDLREVESIADLFRTPAPGQPIQPLGLSGTAAFSGTVQGATNAPHLTGQLIASNLRYNGTAWKVLRTNVDLSPNMASLQNADLESASRGKITFSASAGLNKWSFTENSPVRVDLTASQLNIAELTKLANQQIPVTGTLSANVALHGSELNPVGNGNVTLGNLTAYEQPIQAVKLSFDGTGDEAHGNLSVQLPSGAIQGKATVRPREKTYTAELSASGIQIEKLQAVSSRNLNASGAVELYAKGQGSFDNPQLDASIKIPSLKMQDQTISGINLEMNMADHVANATLQSTAVNTSIQAKAKINLTGNYMADASLDTQSIELGPLLALYAPQANGVSGQTEVHATLHGPLKDKNQLEAHLTIPVLKAAYGNTVQLAAVSPIRADYKNGVIQLQHSAIRGTDTDLEFEGTVPATGNGTMAMMLKGTVNLQLAQLFDPDVRSSGQLRFNIDSHGPMSGSNIGGQIEIVDASFGSGDLPVGLQHGNGVLTLTKDRINIQSFKGTVGGGTVTAQGGVAYSPAVQFDLGLSTQNARILYPQGMRENVDVNLRLSGSTDNAVLGGSVNLTDLSFSRAFDLNEFIAQFSGSVPAPPSRGFAQNLQLNVAVNSANSVDLTSRTLSIGGTANLRVVGTAADPVILGRVNLSKGDIILNGTRFVLSGSTIQFVNPSETQPVVNLTLNTTIQQYDIRMQFQGPIEQLHTQYSSDPSLPTADIINLLAFGETTEASAQSTTTTNQAAESLVASQVSSQVTSRVSKIAGISQLSINPVLAGSNSQGLGAVITIQQRVTGNLFVTFSTNVGSTQSQTIQGQYQVSPKVALSATRDPNGGFGFDTFIKKTW